LVFHHLRDSVLTCVRRLVCVDFIHEEVVQRVDFAGSGLLHVELKKGLYRRRDVVGAVGSNGTFFLAVGIRNVKELFSNSLRIFALLYFLMRDA
jgi:hypothetical protein